MELFKNFTFRMNFRGISIIESIFIFYCFVKDCPRFEQLHTFLMDLSNTLGRALDSKSIAACMLSCKNNLGFVLRYNVIACMATDCLLATG